MLRPSESRWDVIVVGAGPAGSVAASLLAKQRYRVGLVHRTKPKSDWPEVLSPEGKLQLLELGISEEQLSLVGKGCRGVMEWLAADEPSVRDFELHHTATGCFVSRNSFAEMLRDHAIRLGAEAIAFNPLDSSQVRQARFVIDASGLSKPLDGAPKERLYLDRAVGICFHLGGMTLPEDFLHLTTLPSGWMYLLPGPAKMTTAVYITDKHWVRQNRADLEGALRRNLESILACRSMFAGLSSIVCFGFRDARTSCRRCLWRGNWLPIGDAAFAVNPITGSGLARSIRMASEGAKAVAEFLTSGDSDSLETFACQQVVDFHSLANSIAKTPFVQLGIGPSVSHNF